MWDVAFALLTSHACVWGTDVALRPTGVPFLLTALAMAWHAAALPSEVYAYGAFRPLSFCTLLALVDASQCAIHVAQHVLPGARRSHAVHHAARDPTPRDAFVTGWSDALAQIVVPVYAALCVVRPDRTTALVFGLAYSHWLVYLHSALPDHCVPGLVTPSYHRRHHAASRGHYAHVFALC